MLRNTLGKFRFRLRTLLVLMLGIAIGYSLNLYTVQLLTGRVAYTRGPRPYIIEPPDIIDVRISSRLSADWNAASRQYRVEPDGFIYLGLHGSVYVAGHTISEAQDAIQRMLRKRINDAEVTVDLFATNSKVYYIIRRQQNGTATVTEALITGNETVLDAIARIGGVGSDAVEICVSRPAPNGMGAVKNLAVEWSDIATGASDATNYTLLPSDRVIISHPAVNGILN
ncbi:MAG TPA: polysaccharide biosynthesis/export family protein [Lacipirellulaceae bacterium]